MDQFKQAALIGSLIHRQIEHYYLKSFRCFPEELSNIFILILERLEELSTYLSKKEGEKLNNYLLQILDGQNRNDYVTIRDILYYEIKPWLEQKFASIRVKEDSNV